MSKRSNRRSVLIRRNENEKIAALAGLATAALVFAPSAAADVPGLAPFVGSWHAHEEGLDIQPNGNGRETYADKSTSRGLPPANKQIRI